MNPYDEYFAVIDAVLLERLGQADYNTFLRRPAPRAGFIDARRDDGCVPVITEVPPR